MHSDSCLAERKRLRNYSDVFDEVISGSDQRAILRRFKSDWVGFEFSSGDFDLGRFARRAFHFNRFAADFGFCSPRFAVLEWVRDQADVRIGIEAVEPVSKDSGLA